MLVLLLGLPALATPGDCALGTDGYVALKQQLRQLRVAQGHPLIAAGATEGCQAALDDLLRNDPTSGIWSADGHGSASARVRASLDDYVHCGVVIEPAGDAFVLREVGDCSQPPTDQPARIRSVGAWAPGELIATPGVSLRWTEATGGGTAVLLDLAAEVRTGAWEAAETPTWRVLGGVDLSDLGLGTSLVIGGRAGAWGWASTVQPVGQLIVGHRWVGRSVALQAGFGAQLAADVRTQSRGPLLSGTALTPVAEVHLGAPGGRVRR